MKFTRPGLEKEFEELLPMVKVAALRFDTWCQTHGLGPAEVTSIGRDPSFYPDGRFSWHLVKCAIDFRNRHLSIVQKTAAAAWLHASFNTPWWEVITKDHGTGPHFHLAFTDVDRRRAWFSSISKAPAKAGAQEPQGGTPPPTAAA